MGDMESIVEVLLVISAFAAIQGTVMVGRWALISCHVSHRTREWLGVAFVAAVLLAGLAWIGSGGGSPAGAPEVFYSGR